MNLPSAPPESKARRVAALALLVALSWYGLKPWHGGFIVANRAQWHELLSRFPDRHFPGYHEFILGVRQQTPEGASIAIAFPTLAWEQGYSYAYFRADYLLEQRRVIPLALPEWKNAGRVYEAEYVAAWQVAPPSNGWTVVWTGAGGSLVKRSR